MVVNKIDLSGADAAVRRDECGTIARVFLSARSGAGLDLLRAARAEAVVRREDAAACEEEEVHGALPPENAQDFA